MAQSASAGTEENEGSRASQGSKLAQLDENLKKGLDHFVLHLEERLADEAFKIANKDKDNDNDNDPDISHVGEAINQLVQHTHPKWYERVRINPVIAISAVLAVTFGVLGFLAQSSGNAAQAAGFQDIAKIFAGAIVGASAATRVPSGE